MTTNSDSTKPPAVVLEAPDGYHTALGQFIDAFSKAEMLLFWLLMKTADVPLRTAQAIFSDARINNAKHTINRIRASQGIADDEVLTRAFGQLGEIARMRNDIVHYGVTRSPGQEWTVSNAMYAHTTAAFRLAPVSVEILENMSADLGRILLAFTALWIADTEETAEAIKTLRAGALLPWRYKPRWLSQRVKSTPHWQPAQPRPARS